MQFDYVVNRIEAIQYDPRIVSRGHDSDNPKCRCKYRTYIPQLRRVIFQVAALLS